MYCTERGGALVRLLAGGPKSSQTKDIQTKDTGLGRESLYKALSGQGNPSFATLLKVMNALGLRLAAQPMVRQG